MAYSLPPGSSMVLGQVQVYNLSGHLIYFDIMASFQPLPAIAPPPVQHVDQAAPAKPNPLKCSCSVHQIVYGGCSCGFALEEVWIQERRAIAKLLRGQAAHFDARKDPTAAAWYRRIADQVERT